MPTYSARCTKCEGEQDYFAKINDRDNTPSCCDTAMERVLAAPMIPALGLSDHYKVVSPIDGKPLYGRSEYLRTLKKHNVLPESEMKGEAEHRRKEIDAKAKAARRATIVNAIAQHGG